MLFPKEISIPNSALVIQVHIPRTGGTSLRLLINEVIGSQHCLMGYNGEIERKSAEELSKIRLVVGHFGYGIHRHFTKKPYYISVTRDPVDRFISTYAEFRTNENSKYHKYAAKYNINDFLKLVLDTDVQGLWQQLHNLQCRLLCGQANFEVAQRFIDEKYYLLAPFDALNDMVDMFASALGHDKLLMPHVHQTKQKMTRHSDKVKLSSQSIDTIMSSECEDVLLHSYVQGAFSEIKKAFCQARTTPIRPLVNIPRSERIPPKELRFMAESDEDFLAQGDYWANRVLELRRDATGSDPKKLLDIGCGYGRLAYGLRYHNYSGQYEGYDILSRHIAWLNENFQDERGGDYSFRYVNIYNERYNPGGDDASELILPYLAGEFDTLVSLSVFTHLYEEDLLAYFGRLAKLIQEGGIWIATFFCVEQDFSLEAQPEDSIYPLVRKISKNAYIHSEDEPLLVIAYSEPFLLEMFAREGFEVVRRRKGRWLSKENACELQDWFVLQKREANLHRPDSDRIEAISSSNANHALGIKASPLLISSRTCTICGETKFGTGPLSRLSITGVPPRCLNCDSLERHRIIRWLFQALPVGFLDWRNAIQFSRDQSICGNWFRSFEVSDFDGNNSIDLQAINRPDGVLDFISLNHVLESVPNDCLAFSELCRVLSPHGVMQICFGSPMSRELTVDLGKPQFDWKAYHLYGRDLTARLRCHDLGITVLAVEEMDPCTEVREVVHFFFKNPVDALKLRTWISTWSETAKVIDFEVA
ncbi:MAG: methyltransferase domain-containing protein [Nitrosomonas sp.]|nr:MAG: methyltransferase domain-containing protein [Nitrosomonas sp.]